MANATALIFIALYLLIVVYKGNQQALFDALKNDKKFAVWFIAVLAIYYIHENTALGEFGNAMIVLTIVGLLLTNNNGQKIFSAVGNYFKTGKLQ